jgi:hypothetical protein
MTTKLKIVLGLLLGIVVAVGAAHLYFSDRGRFTTEPEFAGLARTVSNVLLRSDQDPRLEMRFADDYQYLGGQKFILYGVADTEQYFFADLDDAGQIASFFWVQFEAYLPDNSYTYNYDGSPGRLQLGAFDFFVDTEVVATDPNRKRRSGTDGAMMRQFLKSKGLTLPPNFLYARLVHLTDTTKRKELMVIYIEDLSPQGMTPAELQDGGARADDWPQVESAMFGKIERDMVLTLP